MHSQRTRLKKQGSLGNKGGTFDLFTANEGGLATEPIDQPVGTGNLEVCAEFLSLHFLKKYMN